MSESWTDHQRLVAVEMALKVLDTKYDFLRRHIGQVENLVTGEGGQALRKGLLALCAKWECVARTSSDPADVHVDEDYDRTQALEDEYRWRGQYLSEMYADFARLVCYMNIGPATPEAREWGRKKVDELGLGEGGQVEVGATPIEARGIPLTVDDILAVRRALSANRKVWAVTAKRREDGIWVFRVAVRNPTPEDDMAIISAHHDWLEAHPEKEFFDVSIDASWGDDEEDLPGTGGQAADGEGEGDPLLGVLSNERCPRCGCSLLVNKRGDRWCSGEKCGWCSVKAPTVDRREPPEFTIRRMRGDTDAELYEQMRDYWVEACAERDALQARVAELEALYQAGQDYANARCQERSELVAEIDKWKAKAKALEPDAALGALVRRGVEANHRVEVMRLERDDAYAATVTLPERNKHGHHLVRHRRNILLDDALRAALGEEATDAE